MTSQFTLDIEEELDLLRDRLENLRTLCEVKDDLDSRGYQFADDLYSQYLAKNYLTPKQWEWVENLITQVKGKEALYGSFNAVFVMFRMAGGNIKQPRIRLITDAGRYILLSFNPEVTSEIKVFVDGYAGHGFRKFAGKIKEDCLIPYTLDRMSEDVRLTLQEFSLDPMRVAKAMAARLGYCMYCGKDLTDPISKHHGYGPVCAKNWGLEWNGVKQRPTQQIDLNSLFEKVDS